MVQADCRTVVLCGYRNPVNAVKIRPNNHWLMTASQKGMKKTKKA